MKPLSVFLFICLISLAGLAGCGMPRPRTDPGLDTAAQTSAEAVRDLNRDISTSKGIARLRMETPTGIQTFQMAWAAQTPDRARLTFTALASPVETVVADGKQVTFLSHTGQHTPHTTTSHDPDLEPFTGVPLKLSDLVCLLLGQVPVQRFSDAWFFPEDKSRIQLHRRFSSQFQELILAPDQPLAALRLKDRHGEIRCEIRFHAFEAIDSRQIPVDLTIADSTGRQVHVSITGFRPDVPVEASVFQLTPFGS
jgi:outer membrane lipoprotein-sorting protein